MTLAASNHQVTSICAYVNASNSVQIDRIANIPNWHFERVIFPGQRLIFEAPDAGILEIYTGQWANVMLAEKIACSKIKINN